MAADYSTLTNLKTYQPSYAAEVPKCWICGSVDAPMVSQGTFPDGQHAGWVPTCQGCFDSKKAPPEDPPGDETL